MAYQIKDEVYESISAVCLKGFDDGVSPLVLLDRAWDNPDFPMHCPEHHYLMAAVLLTTYRRLRGEGKDQLRIDLQEAAQRSRNVLAGFCGWYGTCGAAVGSGIFLSILTQTTPYTAKTWGTVNLLTAECLRDIALLGGPRCCKRVSFTALVTTAAFMKERFGLNIGEFPRIKCTYHSRNAECKGASCPYYGAEEMGGQPSRQPVIIPRFAVPDRAACECKRVQIDLEDKTVVLMWRVQTGEHVKKGDVLCEYGVEKGSFELLSPVDGELVEQCVHDGTPCDIRQPIGYIVPPPVGGR